MNQHKHVGTGCVCALCSYWKSALVLWQYARYLWHFQLANSKKKEKKMKQKHQHSTDAQKNRITECFFLRKKRMRCKKEYTYRERERERKVGNRHISICIMSLRKLLAFPFIFMPSTRLLYKIVQLHHEWIKRFEGRMWQANVGYKHNNKKYLLRIFLIFIIMISPYYCQSSAAFSLSLSLFSDARVQFHSTHQSSNMKYAKNQIIETLLFSKCILTLAAWSKKLQIIVLLL